MTLLSLKAAAGAPRLTLPRPLQFGTGRAEHAAEKPDDRVILSPFAVILSAAKDLALPLRVNYAKNLALLAQGKLPKDLALSAFKTMRDSSFAMLRTAAAPQNDNPS